MTPTGVVILPLTYICKYTQIYTHNAQALDARVFPVHRCLHTVFSQSCTRLMSGHGYNIIAMFGHFFFFLRTIFYDRSMPNMFRITPAFVVQEG